MNPLTIKSLSKIAVLCIVLLFGIQSTNGQELLTLEKALQYSETQSPDIIKSKLSIERQKKTLDAQNAALKSRFSLAVNPANYSRNRRFDTRFSDWYTSENFTSSTRFTVSQPILLTDGTISLNNELGWQSSTSDVNSVITTNQVFYNNLYLSVTSHCLHTTN